MRLKLISCEVFYREMAAASARSPNHIEADFLPPALHKTGPGEKLRRIQETIDACDPTRFQAILLGYGACGVDLAGLRARAIPLVIPRESDCVGHLLSQQCPSRADALLRPAIHLHAGAAPNAQNNASPEKAGPPRRACLDCGLEHLAARYGSEVARYFTEEFRHVRHVPLQESFVNPRRQTLPLAGIRGSRLRTQTPPRFLQRESPLIQQLVDGYWSYDHFLVVPPYWHIIIGLEEGITAVQK